MSFHQFEDLRIESIPPDLDDRTRRIRAQQLGALMGHVQHFYTDTLGLDRIDPDPYPGTDADIEWRMDRLQSVGPVQQVGREIIAAIQTAEDGDKLSESPDAMKGLLVLLKPFGICTDEGHQPTEILEWDVKAEAQGRGIGRAMLAGADIHPQDEVILDVAETNLAAQKIYTSYGFVFDPKIEPMQHGVFDTRHLRMRSRGDLLQHAVNFNELAELADSLSPEAMRDHPILWSAYLAAEGIVKASYNGHLATGRVEYMADNTVRLAKRILERFKDGRGGVAFPGVTRGGRVHRMIATGIDGYGFVRKTTPGSSPQAYFSVFAAYA
jgi:ribosomal protein S18 acetylase RimI-like enzyme